MMGLFVPVEVVAGRILNSVPEGMLIPALAWLVLRLVGRQNSGTRFAVWFTALLAIASLPFVPVLRGAGFAVGTVPAKVTLPESWAVAILTAWGLVATFLVLRIVFGVV